MACAPCRLSLDLPLSIRGQPCSAAPRRLSPTHWTLLGDVINGAIYVCQRKHLLTFKIILNQSVDQLRLHLTELPEEGKGVLFNWSSHPLISTHLVQASIVLIRGLDPSLRCHCEGLPALLGAQVHEEEEFVTCPHPQCMSINPSRHLEQALGLCE
jgi:hypothetical protein